MGLFGRTKESDRPERRGAPFDALVVGLGNPGSKYARTRHNVGFETIELFATRLGVKLKASRDRAFTAEAHIDTKHLLLARPTTYMNESGNAIVHSRADMQ